MEQKNKRKYVKPKITKIYLDAKCAVLGACKTSGHLGPAVNGCGLPFPGCRYAGS
jgi:hypothetical protein